MADPAVPAPLVEVIGPIREADQYQRLQLERQRGLYNLLTGLPGFFWVMPGVLALMFQEPGGPDPLGTAIRAAGWVLFFFACFSPHFLLPGIRRLRPEWESPLVESSLVKKSLEKLFWIQFPLTLVHSFIFVFAVAVFSFFVGHDSPTQEAAWLGGSSLLYIGGMLILAWHARWTKDRPLQWIYNCLVVLVFLPIIVGSNDLINVAAIQLFGTAVVIPPIVAGLVRLFAPRSWLVK